MSDYNGPERRALPSGVTQEEVDFYSEQRQDDIAAAVNRATKRVTRRSTVGFLILLIGLGIGFQANSHTAADSRNKIAVVANRAEDLAMEIQAQRLINIRANCEATNVRHDKAVRSLRALIPAERTGAARAQSLVVIDALADAVAPKQDCDLAVKNAKAGVATSSAFDPKPNG